MLPQSLFEAMNPFGICGTEVLFEFESDTNLVLPEIYKDYLIRFNGALPLKRIWGEKGKDDQNFSLHCLFGLHQGPVAMRLSCNFKLHERNDLQRYERFFSPFVVIGMGSMGEYVLLDHRTGAVSVFVSDFENPISSNSILTNVQEISSDFDSFICGLVTESEYMDATMTPDEKKEFYEKLRVLSQNFDSGD